MKTKAADSKTNAVMTQYRVHPSLIPVKKNIDKKIKSNEARSNLEKM